MGIKDSINKISNIELLRIVAMLMIVAHHYCVHGVFSYWHTNSTLTCYLNDVLLGIISMGGKLGVDIFVLISAYFMITSNCKFIKVVKIYLFTLIYSLLFLVIAYIYGDHHVPSWLLNSSLFPFGGNAYWFISTYLMLYILVPFINRFILTSKKTLLNRFLTITTVLWVLIPTFAPADYCFSNLAWFIYLYFVGASIRLKTFGSVFWNKHLFKRLCAISCITLILYSFIRCLGDNVDLWDTTKLARMQTVFIVSIAVFMFHYFKDLQIKYNTWINWISVSVFGVYLFHDNNLVRPFLWRVVFHPCNYISSKYMILYLVCVVAIVFVAGVIIDKFIRIIFEKHINKFINILSNITIKKRKKIYRKILTIIHRINKPNS